MIQDESVAGWLLSSAEIDELVVVVVGREGAFSTGSSVGRDVGASTTVAKPAPLELTKAEQTTNGRCLRT